MNPKEFELCFSKFLERFEFPNEEFLKIFKRKLFLIAKDFELDKFPLIMPQGIGSMSKVGDKFKPCAKLWSCIIPKEYVKNSDEVKYDGKDRILTIDSSIFGDHWKKIEKNISKKSTK